MVQFCVFCVFLCLIHHTSTFSVPPQINNYSPNSLKPKHRQLSLSLATATVDDSSKPDVVIIGSGVGGLVAANILKNVYKKSVLVLESHYNAGGCAHSFELKGHTFESGPTILLGCSSPPYNPLRQVLDLCGLSVDWIPYKSWGVLGDGDDWDLELGVEGFKKHLRENGRLKALEEFNGLREITRSLAESASTIPAMAMRADSNPTPLLLRHLPSLVSLLSQPSNGLGPFDPYINGPIFKVSDPWLRSWLDALSFSLSGVDAASTPASAIAYVLYDMHREGATLDYPRGGMGSIVDELVRGIGGIGNGLLLRKQVEGIVLDERGERAEGVIVGGEVIKAKEGIICNAPVWALPRLMKGQQTQSTEMEEYLKIASATPYTRSYLHLHLVLNSTGLDLSSLRPHYTVFDKGLVGDAEQVLAQGNMIAVSNPCVLDPTLSKEGTIVMHAYCCGNEDFAIWEQWEGNGMQRDREGYERKKKERAECLWRSVNKVIGDDARERVVEEYVGTPLTHKRFLSRFKGTYGATPSGLLKNGQTPIPNLFLCGDSVFPGIGVPSVALSGAAAANSFVSSFRQILKY